VLLCLSSFYEKEVFSNGDAYELIPNKKTARQILFRLKNKGFIRQVRRGLFAIVPAQMIGNEFSIDRIISTNKILRPFEFQNISYKIINTKYIFGIEHIQRGPLEINVSNRERTVLDCIRNIEYAGGIEELTKSISAFPGLNYKKLLEYLELFKEKSLYHRTGFILDRLKSELNVPQDILESIREHLSKRTYYLHPGTKGVYKKEWNIIVPENITELMKVA